MRYDTPCLKKDWKHAFLMHDDYEHVVIDGIEMTAKNIWEYSGSRDKLVSKLVDYFYNEGFKPWNEMTDAAIEKDFLKLVNADANDVLDKDGSIKNTSRLCLGICRDFCQQSFYATKVNGTASIYDVYKDKILLEKVLKNRLGWYTTTEPLKLKDGTVLQGEHPYLFDISHKMLVQGAHSSMVSANVSNFRPLVAKFLMKKFCPTNGKVLDLSMGWGARMLAALSLGLDYYGIDPMTSKEVDNMCSFLSSKKAIVDTLISMKDEYDLELKDGVSEDIASYNNIPTNIDYVIVCPPYFKLEEYQCKNNSTDMYAEYNEWLDRYWKQTIKNAKSRMKDHAKLTLIMVEKWDKFELLKDMSSIIEQEGFIKVDEMQYKTTRSHLTDKRESRNNSKDSEKVWTFEHLNDDI